MFNDVLNLFTLRATSMAFKSPLCSSHFAPFKSVASKIEASSPFENAMQT
jgi:hypothetical protein